MVFAKNAQQTGFNFIFFFQNNEFLKMFLTISTCGMGNGYEAVIKRALLDSGPCKKVTVLHQLFWFTFRKNIIGFYDLLGHDIKQLLQKKFPSGP